MAVVEDPTNYRVKRRAAPAGGEELPAFTRSAPMERTLTKPTALNLAGDVTLERAEEIISRLAGTEEGSPVSVDLSRYPSIGAGASWRIGNALRRFSGPTLEAALPPLGDSD